MSPGFVSCGPSILPDHGDGHNWVTRGATPPYRRSTVVALIPLKVLRGVLKSIDLMVRREAVILETARRPRATVNDIKDAWKRSEQIRE